MSLTCSIYAVVDLRAHPAHACNTQHALASAGGTRQQGEALLAWAESCPNLPEVAAAQHWAVAWTNDTVDVPCSWTGITRCDDQLLGINLPYVGLQCKRHQTLLSFYWFPMYNILQKLLTARLHAGLRCIADLSAQ